MAYWFIMNRYNYTCGNKSEKLEKAAWDNFMVVLFLTNNKEALLKHYDQADIK